MILTDRERKLQGHRQRMTLLSLVTLTLQSIVVGLFAWSGQVSWPLAGIAIFLSMAFGLTFYLMVATHRNLRLRDPGMLVQQILLSFVLQLALTVLIPRLWVLFLLGIFITYNFAMLSFTRRQYTATWIGLGAGIGLAFYLGREGFGFPEPNGWTMFVFWFLFVAALSRLSVIGAQFSMLREQLSEKNRLLSESVAHIERLAGHDDLTGVLNRRALMTLIAEERERAERTGQGFCVALFDLDHFKSVNDRFGHSTGDDVLRRFAHTVRSQMRTTDRFGRYGGEEFLLVLTTTTAVDVAAIAVQRICTAVSEAPWEEAAEGLRITVSAGLACHRPGESVASLLERTDQALYEAKRRGRNQSVIAM